MARAIRRDSVGNPVFKLGRQRPVARGNRLSLKRYVARAALPTPPSSADYSAAAMAELNDIYLNDQLGDCVIAAGYHMVAVATGSASGSPFNASNAQLIADYSAIGGYDPSKSNPDGTNPTDQGCDEVTALNYWCENGFADKAMPAGWIEVDATSQQELSQAVYLFGHVYLTLELPDAYYGANGINAPKASGFTWDVAGASVTDDGHAIVGVGYTSAGIKIDTWGMLGTMTWGAVSKYCQPPSGGAYVMLTPDIISRAKQKAPSGADWASLVSDLNALGANIPVITSPTNVSCAVNLPVSYQITATNSPVEYFAENLPAGLSVNTKTGAITGQATSAGTVLATVGASNTASQGPPDKPPLGAKTTAATRGGSGVAIVTFKIAAASTKPVITSATSANAVVNTSFTYKITASNSPKSFGATGLPAGLSVNASTGLISGKAISTGTYQITVSASNAAGTGAAKVSLTVAAAVGQIPVITSGPLINGQQGKALTYKITASNSPKSFAVSGLPSGLSVNASSGVISGTPSSAGSTNVTVSATNSAGTGTKAVKFVITPLVTHTPPPTTKPPISSSSIPPTSGFAPGPQAEWMPPPTFALPPIPPVPPTPSAPPIPAMSDWGRQLLGPLKGSRKLGILAASGIVIEGLLAIVSMTDDSEDGGRR